MKKLRIFIACAALLLTAACTKITFGIVNLPAHFSGVKITKNIVFDPKTNLALDIYAPPDAASPLPVIVFFYGGRWEYGDRASYRFAGTTLAQQGFIVAVPDYRKYPTVKFPTFIEDGAKAVAWVHDNIAQYGGMPDHIYVAGHSAGAHIGALLTADEHYLPTHTIKAFAGLAGPYAFTPDEPDLQDMFGPPANYPNMQVTTFIDGKEPPMLLLYGDADTAVKPFNLERLAARIKGKGGRVETRIYPGVSHTSIIGALSWLGKNQAPVTTDMVNFFKGVK